LFGSELISRLLSRVPVLMWVGVLILLHTSVHMVEADPIIEDIFGHVGQIWVWLAAIALSVGFYLYIRLTTGQRRGGMVPSA
jgi:hypothetical protein